MDDVATVERMITRNQLAAQCDEQAAMTLTIARAINTRLNIVTVERIADKVNDDLRGAMPCDCREQGSKARCGSCGR